MNWTQKEERRFSEIDAERHDLVVRRLHAVGKVRAAFDGVDLSEGYLSDDAMEQLLRRADALRDALEPFDSGVRSGSCA